MINEVRRLSGSCVHLEGGGHTADVAVSLEKPRKKPHFKNKQICK